MTPGPPRLPKGSVPDSTLHPLPRLRGVALPLALASLHSTCGPGGRSRGSGCGLCVQDLGTQTLRPPCLLVPMPAGVAGFRLELRAGAGSLAAASELGAQPSTHTSCLQGPGFLLSQGFRVCRDSAPDGPSGPWLLGSPLGAPGWVDLGGSSGSAGPPRHAHPLGFPVDHVLVWLGVWPQTKDGSPGTDCRSRECVCGQFFSPKDAA